MRIVEVEEASSSLSSIVDEVAAGADVVIAKAGKPLVRLVAMTSQEAPMRIGMLKGKIWVSDNFDDPLPEDILRLFEGG